MATDNVIDIYFFHFTGMTQWLLLKHQINVDDGTHDRENWRIIPNQVNFNEIKISKKTHTIRLAS